MKKSKQKNQRWVIRLRALSLLVLLVMSLCLTTIPVSAATTVAKIHGLKYIPNGKIVEVTNKYGVNSRDSDGKVIEYIKPGSKLLVFGVDASNSQRSIVFYNDTFGSVLSGGLRKTGFEFQYVYEESYTAKNKYGLNFRDVRDQLIEYISPGALISVFGVSRKNEARSVVLIGTSRGVFIGTVLNGGLTPVNGSVSEDKETEPSEPTTTTRRFFVTTAKLSLRKPDGSGEEIQLLQPGEVVELLGKDPYNANRVLVLWHGIKGSLWNVSMKELKNVPEFYGTGYEGVDYTQDLNFRVGGNNSELICKIKKNHYFQVLGTYSGDATRVVVIFRGRIGTVTRPTITRIRGTGVFIDEVKQMATLIKKGKFVANTPCVTGTKGMSETPKGKFQIAWMASPFKLKGIDLEGRPYARDVDYWMPFKGGCGLHDAKWRSSFGGSIYKWNGSLGCVNLPLWFAKKVFHAVKPGDVVCVAA